MYFKLDECARNIIRSVGRYDVICYVDANFLQLFIGNVSFTPKLLEFEQVPIQRVDGVDRV